MQGGLALFLVVVIFIAAVLAGLYLTGAGGYLRHQQMEGELDDEAGDHDDRGGRPQHLRVENEANADSAVAARPAGGWAGAEGDADSSAPPGTAGRDPGGDGDVHAPSAPRSRHGS